MLNKNDQRLRRAKQTRIRIAKQGAIRLSVHRSNTHIYATVFSADGLKVLASASSLGSPTSGSTVEAAKSVGTAIAEKAKAQGVSSVAFDRAGYAYHGRIKALADAAREAGLSF